MRLASPNQGLFRICTEDAEVAGTRIPAGSMLWVMFGSANRDEREFDDPDTFDISRRAKRILSFGHGQHQCLGAHVARLEGRILIEEVLRRIPDYEVDAGGIERLRSEFFRGFGALPIHCKAG